jgi:hypothetical protein
LRSPVSAALNNDDIPAVAVVLAATGPLPAIAAAKLDVFLWFFFLWYGFRRSLLMVKNSLFCYVALGRLPYDVVVTND